MATEHDPSAFDAPIQPGGVPRHASAKERKGRGLKPFLSDLKAEVQNQLSRAEPFGRAAAPVPSAGAHGQVTQALLPASPQEDGTAPEAQYPDNGAALASAALATADHAGSEAAAARADAVAARAEAEAARHEAAAARAEVATARATAARADTQLQAARAEIEAAHQEFEALRTQFDAAVERTGRHLLIAWIGAGAAGLLAVVALVLGF